MTERERIIYVADACRGTVEGSPEHQTILDIYNQYKPKPRYYNMKKTDPWCAAFVSAVYIAAGLADRIPIECSCFYMKNHAAAKGMFRDPARYVPKPGDLLFYKWDGKTIVTHVGIVRSVKGSALEVIEGNYNDKVGVRNIKLSYPYIDSYCEVDLDG